MADAQNERPSTTDGTLAERPVVPLQPQFSSHERNLGEVALTPEEFNAEIARLRARTEILERENAALRASVGRLSADEFIADLLTPQGMREGILHSPDLRSELSEGRFAVMHVDVRGVKALNDESMPHGNELLALVAERVLEHSLRGDDIIYRHGDDFTILVRSISRQDLPAVVKRLQRALSVERAMADIKKDSVPVIASVSSVHADEILHGELDTYTGLIDFIDALSGEASARNVTQKHEQYVRMWQLVNDPGVQPGDERRIADAFIAKFCPHFIEQIEALMYARRQALITARNSR